MCFMLLCAPPYFLAALCSSQMSVSCCLGNASLLALREEEGGPDMIYTRHVPLHTYHRKLLEPAGIIAQRSSHARSHHIGVRISKAQYAVLGESTSVLIIIIDSEVFLDFARLHGALPGEVPEQQNVVIYVKFRWCSIAVECQPHPFRARQGRSDCMGE